MDVDKNKDADKNNDENKNKKIFKWEYLLLFVAFVFPIIISFFTSFFNQNLPQFNFYTYVGKCLLVVKQNMGYYGTVFGLFLAMKKYSENKEQNEKERQEKQELIEQELIRTQEESNLLREKEIENRKDNYRPTFVINDNIELLMRKEESYLYTIVYSTWNKDKSKNEENHIGTLKSGDCIVKGTYENPIPDNFYITAETILGEKILFGFLFGEYKIYKYLNEYGNPLFPRGKNLENYSSYKIKENWTSYNALSNINSYEEILDESIRENIMLFNNLEKIFFFNSQELREYLYFNKVESIQNIINSSNHLELYNKLFADLTTGYSKPKYFTDNSIIEVINAVYTQVYYNADLFKMSNIKTYEEYIIKKIQVLKKEVELKDEEELFVLTEKLKNYFKAQNFENIKLILDCIKKIVEYAKKLPNESNGKYRVLECCLKVLKVVFENVEEKEMYKELEGKFLYHKSEILREIEFEEE